MFDRNSPIVKIGGYVIIGFFTLIIIISFGMPDFVSRLGLDQNMVASVNGEQIHRLDYARYKQRFSQYLKGSNTEQMERMILDRLIMQRLMIQKARDLGIQVPKVRITRNIKEIQAFKDKDGKFSNDSFTRYLEYTHQSRTDFFSMLEEDMVMGEFRSMMEAGVAIPQDDINFEYMVEKSRVQIKYCFISSKDLRNRYKSKLKVSDKEIDEEIKKTASEGPPKDLKAEKKKVQKRLESRKFNKIKRELVRTMDKWANENRGFSQSAAHLGGKTLYSQEFKIGDTLKQSGKKGKPLYSLSNSQIFKDTCLSIDIGKTSRAVDSFDGIYVFTPVKKAIVTKEPGKADVDRISKKLINEKSEAIFMSLMSDLRDKAKIIKNLKFN